MAYVRGFRLIQCLLLTAALGGSSATSIASRSLMQARIPARAPAPAPAAKAFCSLPDGRTVAYTPSSNEQGLLTPFLNKIPGIIGILFGRRRQLLATPAPAPGGRYAYAACCPSRLTLPGDTASSLVSDPSLIDLFYALNRNVTPQNAASSPITPAGQNVTVPCARILSIAI